MVMQDKEDSVRYALVEESIRSPGGRCHHFRVDPEVTMAIEMDHVNHLPYRSVPYGQLLVFPLVFTQ